MPYAEDHIMLAAEYALGTLNAEEREQAEAMMAMDREFEAIVEAWQLRLAALNQMVGPVEPRPVVWERIQAGIAAPAVRSPEPVPPIVAAPEPVAAPQVAAAPAQEMGDLQPAQPVTRAATNVIDLDRRDAGDHRVRRWRGLASAAMALAAALFVVLSLQIYAPDALPGGLRPPLRIRTVEVKVPQPAPAAPAQYVALLQAPGGGPAFILTVDGATKNFTVRKVDAAPEPGKSYELWLISDKLSRPRSLGVIGNGDFTTRPVLANYDPELVNAATYAVTVEQAGGSPDGQPHSAPVFTGKLIETVPSTANRPPPQQAPAQQK